MNGSEILSEYFTEEQDEIYQLEESTGSIYRVIHGREEFDDETLLIRFLEGKHDYDALLEADNRELELEFYSEETPNQWNIQLFWVYNDENRPEEEVRQRLQTDTRFAIRRCVPVESLGDFITPLEQSKRKLEEISPDFKRQDLIQRIIDHDLGLLFNRDTSRDEKIKQITEGGAEVDIDVLPEGNLTTARRAFIDLTELGEFRPQALERKLDAAPFTLLYGPNGTGKTSLLDGTAMGMVGQIPRGEARADTYDGLEVTLEGDTEPLPTNSSDVNDRVADWFGFRPQGSAHRFIEFYRVNYHESGETTRLLQSGTELEIEQTLRRFLYGEDLMYAKKEKEELAEILEEKIGEHAEDIQKLEEELQELTERKSELNSIFSTLDTARHDLSPAATKIVQAGSKKDKTSDKSEFQSPTERIDHWTTWEQRFERLRMSLDALKDQDFSHTTPINLQRKLQTELGVIEEYLNELDTVDRLLEEKGRLDTLEDYYEGLEAEVPASVVLIALILRSNSIDAEDIELLTQALEETDSGAIDPKESNSIGEWQDTVVATLRGELERLEERRAKLEEINDLEKRRRELQRDIRENTEEYLSMTEHVEHCPACYTEQSAEDILTRDEPEDLHGGAEGIPNSLTERIGVFQDALEILSMSAWDHVHREIDRQFNDVCNFRGFQELWTNHLREGEAAIMFPDASDSFVQTLVAGLRADSEYQINNTSIDIALRSARERVETNLSDHALSIPEFDPSKGEVQEFREGYINRRNDIENGLNVFKEYWLDEAWHEEINVKADLQTLRATVADMEERPSIPASSEKLSTELDEIEDRINHLKEQRNQWQEGLSRLTSAFEGADVGEKLDQYVQQHMTIISTLFKAFQRPYQFDSVELIDGKVKVTRQNTDYPVKITKMSSGQRAALALAIFVTHNLAHDSAPPVMLLDEPFAHLDDVNTISFFNLLIELATRKERQIIFATASDDIAALLERKVGDSSKFTKVSIGDQE